MIHAFTFHDGLVSYANKFLRSDDYTTVAKTGKMSYRGFLQDPCKSRFKSFLSWFLAEDTKDSAPNANVNIARFGNRFVALTETPLPIEFHPGTLNTVGVMHYDDGFPEKDIHDTAHPHYDPERKEHIGYFTQFGRVSTHTVYSIKDGSTKREPIYSLNIDKPSYMHSFFITKNYAILTLLPLVVNPLDLLLKRKAFIKNFKWQPDRGTTFVVINRIHNKLQGMYKSEPFFSFHTVNAFEKDTSLILDAIVYPNSKGLAGADLSTILGQQSVTPTYTTDAVNTDAFEIGKLTRFTIDLEQQTVTSHSLINELLELPRIHYDAYNGRDYTYVYAYARHTAPAYVADQLLKVNVKSGHVKKWTEDQCYPGEPVFIANPHAHTEDDGVILSVVLDAQRQQSFLLVLDAQEFKEIARAEVPHHIPFGIHGFYSAHEKIKVKN